MVSKKKIGICLAIITVLAILLMSIIDNSYECDSLELDLFWGLFAMCLAIILPCMAIGVYMLSVYFKETKPKLSKFLWGFGIYILVAAVGGIAYSICNIYGVISL